MSYSPELTEMLISALWLLVCRIEDDVLVLTLTRTDAQRLVRQISRLPLRIYTVLNPATKVSY